MGSKRQRKIPADDINFDYIHLCNHGTYALSCDVRSSIGQEDRIATCKPNSKETVSVNQTIKAELIALHS